MRTSTTNLKNLSSITVSFHVRPRASGDITHNYTRCRDPGKPELNPANVAKFIENFHTGIPPAGLYSFENTTTKNTMRTITQTPSAPI
jgi:hypothetical protein